MKKFTILFSPQALDDIDEAVDYYNKISWGPGNRFLSDFEQTYRMIALNLFFASVKYHIVRCADSKNFLFRFTIWLTEKQKL
jgi:hypothetical protein